MEDITISIKIDNDSRGDFTFTVWSVYMNNKAYPFNVESRLKRRENVNLKLSEVLKKSIEQVKTTFLS